MSGGGKGGEITVGYRYHLGMHMALCHGPIDQILEIQVDGRVAWEGSSEAGSITVDAPDLFGGDKREGGVSGKVDFEFGGPLQGANSYLTSVLPDENPAYRGVACAVLNQCYMGNNPYLKPWAFTAQRIYVAANGEAQWNIDAAGLAKGLDDGPPLCRAYNCEAFDVALTQNQMLQMRLYSLDAVLANHQDPFEGSAFNGVFFDDGSSVGWATGGNVASSVLVGSGVLTDPCEGAIQRVFRWDSRRVSTRVGIIQPRNRAIIGDTVWIMDPSSFNASSGVSGTLIRVARHYVVTRPAGSDLGFTAAAVISFRIEAGDIQVQNPQSGDGWVTIGQLGQGVWAEKEGLMGLSLFVQNPGHVYIDNSPFTNQYLYTINIRGRFTLATSSGSVSYAFDAGQHLTSSGYFDYGQGAPSFTFQPDASQTGSYYMLGAVFDAWAFGGSNSATPIDVSEFVNAMLQNRRGGAGYVPPEDCCNDMNPAHIIRECLTQPWGLGYQSADIDDTSFTAAATTLLSEGMGISILWDKEVPIEDFVSEILRHIDGVVYVSRATGKFVLKLIRNDYDEASLITLDETNARMASDARRPTIGELVTSVTVEFTDVDQDEETGSVTLHNEALIQLQGAVNNASVQYPGFMTRSIASRVAQRDLRALSTPLMSCDIEAGRIAADLNIGDAFKLNFPEQGIYELVMRVESMSVGDGKDNTVKISCVEDAFSVPDFAAVGDTGPGWVNPVDGAPQESEPRLMIESPYYELVQRVGDREAGLILADDPDAGFLFANGGRQGGELNADLMVDGGSGYVDSGILDFAPYATLALDAWYSDSKLYYTNGKDLDTVAFPARAQIGQEIVRVDSLGVDSNGAFMSVGRGILDTVPAEHFVDSNGLPIVFFDPATDNIQYTASDSVNVKLLTALGSQRLADASADTITFNSRSIRPYPPGNLEIDLESYPKTKIWDGMHSLSWAHRDRLQQTSGVIFDYTEGDIGPEAGTTYRVTADAILTGGGVSSDFIDVDVGSATDWEQDSNTDSNVGPPPEDADYIRFKVTSYRDGYESWQPAMVVIPMPEPFDSIGFDSAGFDSQPDSGGALWTPAEITTAAWWDASDTNNYTLVSSAYSEILDKSGNSRTASQGDAARRPTHIAAGQNGLDIARFDGSNDQLNLVSFAQVSGQTIIMVGDTTSLGTGYRGFLERSSGASDNLALLLGSAVIGANYKPRIYWNAGAGDRAGWGATVQRKALFRWGFATGSPASALTQVDAGTPVTQTFTASALTNWAMIGGADTQNSAFDFYEAVILPPGYTQGDVDRVHGYLAWKWGLESNLPSGHPYEFGAPTI